MEISKAVQDKLQEASLLWAEENSKNTPGIYEVDMGTPLSTVINQLGGGFRIPIKAMHIGGPLGGLVPVSKIDSLTVDFDSFALGRE